MALICCVRAETEGRKFVASAENWSSWKRELKMFFCMYMFLLWFKNKHLITVWPWPLSFWIQSHACPMRPVMNCIRCVPYSRCRFSFRARIDRQTDTQFKLYSHRRKYPCTPRLPPAWITRLSPPTAVRLDGAATWRVLLRRRRRDSFVAVSPLLLHAVRPCTLTSSGVDLQRGASSCFLVLYALVVTMATKYSGVELAACMGQTDGRTDGIIRSCLLTPRFDL